MNLFIKKTLAIIVATIAISSCSKDNEVAVETSGNYRLLSATTENASYKYNPDGLVMSIYDVTGAVLMKRLTYSANKKIEQIVDEGSQPNQISTNYFHYYPNGKLEDVVTIENSTIGSSASKIKRVYEYTSLWVLDVSGLYVYNPALNDYDAPSLDQIFTFNAQGQLTSFTNLSKKYEYAYDSNANIIEEKILYNNILKYKITYNYDNKKNPMHNLLPKTNPTDITSPNNIKSKTITNYNANGTIATSVLEGGVVVPGVRTFNYNYEYNNGGYPTKQTGGTRDETFNYEKL